MTTSYIDGLNRREFISKSVAAGTAMYLGLGNDLGLAAVEPPPETTTVRFQKILAPCWVPQLMAEPLLREEGFTDIQYIEHEKIFQGEEDILAGRVDFAADFTANSLMLWVPGDPIDFISGFHIGCYSLIGSDKIKTVRDLKGKKVWAWTSMRSGPAIFFKTLVAYVGLDPDKDIEYVLVPKDEAMELFKRGKIDALMSFPPGPQQLREQGIGRVLVDTNVDRPWSQYFCCMVNASKKFTRENPIATKRALRAILKSNDIVDRDPEFAARVLLERKIIKEAGYKYIVQDLKETPYYKWRDYNPEDTVRFYTLRLHELGITKLSPQEIIDKNCDWRFLKSLKDELNITFI